MKTVQINSVCGTGSTGRICADISRMLTGYGVENRILYSTRTDGYPLGVCCTDRAYIRRQAIRARLLGNYGFNSAAATRRMLAWLDEFSPDIVHLHNIHGHDCHLGMLFDWLRGAGVRVIWTFHDCWPFTAYCPHFTLADCDRWKTGCHDCPQRAAYSLFLDRSRSLYARKKALIRGLDLTVVTPSAWLARLAGESFFADTPIRVINNGIDVDRFRPTDSRFREEHGIRPDQTMVLGVAYGWGYAKGLDVFCTLAERLDLAQYRIVLVGTDEKTEATLPPTVIPIRRTQSQEELAQIYTAADVFVNPTREENYPTVNMEAIACGTPVITFDTGGSPECIDADTGAVVPCNDTDALMTQIAAVRELAPYRREALLRRAESFDKNRKYREYAALYGLGGCD